MISLIVPYVLTLLGIIIDNVHNFPAMAGVLTAVGVIWTWIRCMRNDIKGKGMLVAVGVHGIIWLLFRVFPNFGSKLVGIVIGLLVAVLILAFAYVYILAPLFSTNTQGSATSQTKRIGLPDIIYDDNNNEWRCTWRSQNGEVQYRNAAGQEVMIYHSEISGHSANTSAGTFHWYN